jgi:hypothetical protein
MTTKEDAKGREDGDSDDSEGDDDFDIPEYYTNATGVEIGAFDVTLSIGVADASDPGNRREYAIVRMSPQHALVVTAMLMKFVNVYENSTGGPMPLSQELIRLMGLEPQIAAIRALGASTSEKAKAE